MLYSTLLRESTIKARYAMASSWILDAVCLNVSIPLKRFLIEPGSLNQTLVCLTYVKKISLYSLALPLAKLRFSSLASSSQTKSNSPCPGENIREMSCKHMTLEKNNSTPRKTFRVSDSLVILPIRITFKRISHSLSKLCNLSILHTEFWIYMEDLFFLYSL